MTGRLEGKVALITGGASGLGEATVRLFVEEGARVVISDLQVERGEALASELGAAAIFQRTDVTHESDIAAAVDSAMENFGRLDCTFNNAGIVGAVGPIDEITADEYDFTMSVILRGVFLGNKHSARVMKPQGFGCILNCSSIAGVMGGLGPHVYTAAKAAIIGLTRNVAAELIPHGIRVNCIAPGNIATPMIAGMVTGDPDQMDPIKSAMDADSPIKNRGGRATDIAQAALYLTSDAAAFVNGHTLVVDAGLTTGSGKEPPGLITSHTDLVREAGHRGVPDAE
jgi:NAD(P)-dependent dehydrogenase (short-subunit alcohol dehydrogenase family)